VQVAQDLFIREASSAIVDLGSGPHGGWRLPDQICESVKHVIFARSWQEGLTCQEFSHQAPNRENVYFAVVLALPQDYLWGSVPPRAHIPCILQYVPGNLLRETKISYFQLPIGVQQIFRLKVSVHHAAFMAVRKCLEALLDDIPHLCLCQSVSPFCLLGVPQIV
jgi:hypothetical protein